jgi:hypothetical protein
VVLGGGHLLCLDGEGGDPGYLGSQPYPEGQVCSRVRALGNVSVRDRCAVAGLVTTPTRDRSPASGCGLPAANKKK